MLQGSLKDCNVGDNFGHFFSFLEQKLHSYFGLAFFKLRFAVAVFLYLHQHINKGSLVMLCFQHPDEPEVSTSTEKGAICKMEENTSFSKKL